MIQDKEAIHLRRGVDTHGEGWKEESKRRERFDYILIEIYFKIKVFSCDIFRLIFVYYPVV